MISTFLKVFPDGVIWSNDNYGEGYDVVLFGQAEPIHIDVEKLEKKFNSVEYGMVRQSLEDVGFYSIQELLGTYAGNAQNLKAWMADAQINTDRNMRLSYLSGMSINYFQAKDIFWDICDYYKFPENLFSGSGNKLDSLQFVIENKLW